METIKNAYFAPFSSEAAGKTSPAKIAIAYVVAGFLIGNILK